MKAISYISEKYRKYLLEVTFAGQKYYTVFGADYTENETDKLLVDITGRMLLFSSSADLLSSILKTTYFFDTEVLQTWAKEILDIEKSYQLINFDVLTQRPFDVKDIKLFKSIYDTIGVIEDYANQVRDEKLLAVLTSDILLQFKNDLASYFIWSGTKIFKLSVDVDVLHLSLSDLHARLKERLNVS